MIEDACLVPGTKIFCSDSFKNIEDVKEGDLVWTNKGRLKKVTKIFVRDINEEIINLKYYYNRLGLKLTKNHALLVLNKNSEKPGWVSARDLRTDDLLVFSKPKFPSCQLEEFKFIKHPNNIKNKFEAVKTNEDFFKLAGLFLAEGNVNKRGLIFSLGQKEADLITFIENCAQEIFNRKVTKTIDKRNEGLQLRINGNQIAREFEVLFGRGAKNKKLPEAWLGLKEKYVLKILEGLFLGDAQLRKEKLNFGTTSIELARQVYLLLISLGCIPSFGFTKGGKVKIRGKEITPSDSWHLYLTGNERKLLYKKLRVKSKEKTRHTFGKQDLDFVYTPIINIMTEHYTGKVYNLEVEEDNSYSVLNATLHNCQAHGAEFQGKKVGSFGTGCFSFYPTKNMTTGEGGMITTNDDKVAAKIRKIINHGSEKKYFHDFLGYNYRMTDIAAAIGLEQLKKLNSFNEERKRNARFLNEKLGLIKGLILPEISGGNVFHQYTVRITPEFRKTREELINFLSEKGVNNSVFYPLPVHKQRAYKRYNKHGFPVAEKLAKEVLSLPVHPSLTEEDLNLIVKAFEGQKYCND
ncbi:MAG: DegT/DnrJ/EryC1/StrS family aminotransferase [Nanoarchaeota archaeon]